MAPAMLVELLPERPCVAMQTTTVIAVAEAVVDAAMSADGETVAAMTVGR